MRQKKEASNEWVNLSYFHKTQIIFFVKLRGQLKITEKKKIFLQLLE